MQSESRERFGKQLKGFLQRFGYTTGIDRLTDWESTENNITGHFVADKRVFSFEVTRKGISYKPVNPSDAYQLGRNDTVDFYHAGINKESYLLGRLDTRSEAKCSIGYKCGRSCINNRKECLIRSGVTAKLAGQAIDKAQKFNLLGFGGKQTPVADSSNSKVKKALKVVEDSIRQNLDHEEGAIINHEGKVLFRAKGDATSVNIPQSEVEKMKGQIFTHNHPTWNYQPDDPRLEGRSLSHPDLMAATVTQVAEIRAVAPGYTYSLKPGKDGWGGAGKVNRTYTKHAIGVHLDLTKQIREGKTTAKKAERDFQGEIVRRTAKDLGWEYKEEKRTITKQEKAKAKKFVNTHGEGNLPGSGDTAKTLAVMGMMPYFKAGVLGAYIYASYATAKAEQERVLRENGNRYKYNS